MSALTYSVSFSGTSYAGIAVSAVQDLFCMTPSSSVAFRVRRISLSASGATAPANVILSVQRYGGTLGNTTSGTAQTPGELGQVSGRAATTAVYTNQTTRATGTTKAVLWVGSLQELINYDDVIVPELIPVVPPLYALIIGVEVTPSASVTMYGTVHFSELD